jgi:uncharacterized protein YneF (UPF0154 family)
MGMPAIRLYIIVSLIVILGGGYFYQLSEQAMARTISDDPRVWESTIQAFETEDKLNPPAKGAVVFLGGSSISGWETLAEDMQPLKVVNRGFGGAKVTDLIYFIDRLLGMQSPSAVVVVIGASDLSTLSGNKPKKQQQLSSLYQQLLEKIKNRVEGKPIYLLANPQKPAENDFWASIESFNQSLGSMAGTDKQLHYIESNLLSQQGYVVWSEMLKEHLSPSAR